MKNTIIAIIIGLLVTIIISQQLGGSEQKSINDNLAKQNMELKNDVAVAGQPTEVDELIENRERFSNIRYSNRTEIETLELENEILRAKEYDIDTILREKMGL
jgi:hypothetical protein